MGSALLNTCLVKPPQVTPISANKPKVSSGAFQEKNFSSVSWGIDKPGLAKFNKNSRVLSCPPVRMQVVLQRSLIPLAASLAILFGSYPAHAGILSGFPGIESVPGPQLPQIDFLNRFNEKNQKMYAENDAKFKESPLLKKLLEKTKLNKEKNKREILDKYCIRGAEWGVGDCSTEGMSPEERDKFIAMLKQKAGME